MMLIRAGVSPRRFDRAEDSPAPFHCPPKRDAYRYPLYIHAVSEFIPVIALSRCRPNAGTFVSFKERELAVFRFGEPERVVVTDNSCPHASGNLSGGAVEEGVVICPWHAWPFDLTTGQCTRSADVTICLYPVEVRDGMVYVQLELSADGADEYR